MFEIEQKFPVRSLTELGRRITREFEILSERSLSQTDCYYERPNGDPGPNDESLRIRDAQSADGDRVVKITWKGPRVDAGGSGRHFKTRHEVEIEVAGSDAVELLEALGYRKILTVVKSRREFSARWKDSNIRFALDDVCGLGTFVEIEMIVDHESKDQAWQAIGAAAQSLGLSDPITDSYRIMLAEKTVEKK